MTAPAEAPSRRVLDPVERLSEVIFGIIMALTFTGTLSIATAGREDVREMLIGAIGCNTAWGIVDGVMYVIGALVQRQKEGLDNSVTWRDLKGALACFLLVFSSTFPLVIPFLVIDEAHRALRWSNAVALVMLYITGHSLGKWAGFRPFRSGLVMVLIGLILTVATIALGG